MVRSFVSGWLRGILGVPRLNQYVHSAYFNASSEVGEGWIPKEQRDLQGKGRTERRMWGLNGSLRANTDVPVDKEEREDGGLEY